jgi:hypothetical protein
MSPSNAAVEDASIGSAGAGSRVWQCPQFAFAPYGTRLRVPHVGQGIRIPRSSIARAIQRS